MKRISGSKTLALSLVVASLLTAGSGNAQAMQHLDSPAPLATSHQQSALLSSISEEHIHLYSQHVTSDLNGNYRIKQDSRLSPANKAILQGLLDTSNKERREFFSSTSPLARIQGNTVYGPGGSVQVHWWGYSVALNNLETARIQHMLTIGAGVSAIAALLTSFTGVGGAVASALAAALTIVNGVYGLCNWNGRGIYIHRSFTGQSWCSPR